MKKIVCHRDGTVTYWSVYNQVWEHRASGISNRELAAMNNDQRERVTNHIYKHGGWRTSWGYTLH